MDSLEPKKLALIRILQILQTYSDSEHPLKQEEIARRLDTDYGIVLERKAVSRNLSLLKEAGYEIVSEKRGSYLDERPFDDSELRLLIDSVIAYRQISKRQADDLVTKISQLSNKYFSDYVKKLSFADDLHGGGRSDLFYNIEAVTAAVKAGRQIEFEYEAGILPAIPGYMDQVSKAQSVRLSPIQITMKDHRYHLIGIPYEEQQDDPNGDRKDLPVKAYRLDLIRNIRELKERSADLRSTEAFKDGFQYSKAQDIVESAETFDLICSYFDLGKALDYFGDDVRYRPIEPLSGADPLEGDYNGPRHSLNTDVFLSFTANYPILLTVKAGLSRVTAFMAELGNVMIPDQGLRRLIRNRFAALADGAFLPSE